MIPAWFAIVLIAAGTWNIGDGIVSILYYRKQSIWEHLVRVIRILFGALILAALHYAWGG